MAAEPESAKTEQGTPRDPRIEITPDPKARVKFFACFLRSGGVVSVREFVSLLPQDLEALTGAGAIVEGERAALIAEAIVERLRPAAPPAAVADPFEAAGRIALGAQ